MLYGLGTILGAGIYVLIGEVAARAGSAAPSAFLLASVLAGVTAFSYAELSARLPKSAGEAVYVAAGFKRPWLAIAVGWAVILTGVVSAATMARGFVGYLDIFIELPTSLVIFVTVGALGALASWGISESLFAAAAVTLLEIAGLVLVCVLAADSLTTIPDQWRSLLPDASTAGVIGIVSGAFVAFYAFIGFEDMVNVAEEVKTPTRTLPRAIILALFISTGFYFLVATVAVLTVPPESLAGSAAPLALLVSARGMPPEIIAAISLVAVLNGGLIQIIMASRVLYGLASQRLAWAPLARVHPATRTPLLSTAAVTMVVLMFALFFSLGGLASFTSFVALAVFAMVNASLWRLKRQTDSQPAFTVPHAVPIVGFMLCIAMLGYQSAVILGLL